MRDKQNKPLQKGTILQLSNLNYSATPPQQVKRISNE
jgi:hypothetical protein